MVDVDRVQVGPFRVADVSAQHVVKLANERLDKGGSLSVLSLHVGGLNARRRVPFLAACSAADLLLADGKSVSLLARFGGKFKNSALPTTDFGWDLIQGLAVGRESQLRVAIVGGRPGIAASAFAKLASEIAGIELVYSTHGYHTNETWPTISHQVEQSSPDLIILGLGMPLEAEIWHSYFADISPGVLLTCGGWLNFLSGGEKRAPEWMRRRGIEWAFRLSRDPRRLARRYLLGILSVTKISAGQLLRRVQ